MYVIRDSGPAWPADLDLIAAARTYLPRLVDEVERQRKATGASGAAGPKS
jgi:hypothetical protein